MKNDDSIECLECGRNYKALTSHLNRTHKMTVDNYRQKHGQDVRVMCKSMTDNLSVRFSGENNPGYNHQGRLSPWSKKSNFHSPASHATAIKNAKKTPSSNNIQYWINRGYSESGAKDAVSERQRTFSKEKCIERYGEEDGLRRWKERQDKWQDTLNAKSDEEKAEINKKRTRGGFGGASKESASFFSTLQGLIPEYTVYQFKDLTDANTKEFALDRPNGRKYYYDLYMEFDGRRIIVEYHGVAWHPREGDTSWSQPRSNISYEEQLSKDIDKRDVAIASGCEYFSVFSDDADAVTLAEIILHG